MMFAYSLLLLGTARLLGLVSATDYPPNAITLKEQGAVLFEVVVRPDGNPDTCTVLVSSGYKDLDDVTCRIVMERARFSPATRADQKPVYGTYKQVISWSIDRPVPHPDGPHLELTVVRAPAGISLPRDVKISYFHGANGEFGECSAEEPGNDPQPFIDLACKAANEAPGAPVRNRAGQAVDAMDHAVVRFKLPE